VGGNVDNVDVDGLDHDACAIASGGRSASWVTGAWRSNAAYWLNVALAPDLAPRHSSWHSRLWSPTQIAILCGVAAVVLTESGLITVGPKRPT